MPPGVSTSSVATQFKTQVRSLPDIAGGTTFTHGFLDGPHVCNNLPVEHFANDYDDQYGCLSSAQPGNIQFTFTSTRNGRNIFAVFNPTTNDALTFVGFVGLDPNGFAGSSYDNGVPPRVGEFGLLANIFVGCPPGTHQDPTPGQCVANPPPSVGGIILPADMTTLFITGQISNAFWILPTFGGIGGSVIALFKIKTKHN